jgi:hypothetical protein
MNFNDILEILESDKKILDFKFEKSQIPMYLVIRFNLIQSLINKEFNLSNPHVKSSKKSIKEILKYIYHTLKSNLFFAPKKDIYIFSSDMLNVLDANKYKNRLHDNLFKLFNNQTQLFEASHNFQYKYPKYRKVYHLDLILILSRLCSFFIQKKEHDLLNIELLIEYINVKVKLDTTQKQELKSILIKYSKRISIEYYLYDLFIKIKKPKILIVDCTYYGAYIPLILTAKKHKVKTVEYQHGYVGFAHPAYNYHENIFNKISKYYPEYFLTHGDYWSNVVRVPSKKVAIGLPELSKKIDNEANIIFKVIIMCALILIYFGNEIGILLGNSSYYSAFDIIPIIVLGYVFNTIFMFYGWGIGYAKKNIYLSIVVVISTGINILLNILFIPKFGYIGAAIATSIAYLFLIIFTWFTNKYILKLYTISLYRIFTQLLGFGIFIIIFYIIELIDFGIYGIFLRLLFILIFTVSIFYKYIFIIIRDKL